jgi:hypothetical protein
MRRPSWAILLVILPLLPLLLSACDLGGIVPGIEHTCNYHWPALAFQDWNGNGARDGEEPPLENVRLLIEDAPGKNNPGGVRLVRTEAEEVEIGVTGFGWCPSAMSVSATPPQGWTATTPTNAKVVGEPQAGALFGFRWTAATPYKIPPTGHVQAYGARFDPTGEGSGYVYTSNGDLWVALNGTHGPLRRYRGDREQPFEIEGFPRACGIAADHHDNLWMGSCYGGGCNAI